MLFKKKIKTKEKFNVLFIEVGPDVILKSVTWYGSSFAISTEVRLKQ